MVFETEKLMSAILTDSSAVSGIFEFSMSLFVAVTVQCGVVTDVSGKFEELSPFVNLLSFPFEILPARNKMLAFTISLFRGCVGIDSPTPIVVMFVFSF
jgi:hypothetical protein